MQTSADFQNSTYRFGAYSDRGMERDYQEDNLLLAPDLAKNEWTYHSDSFQPGEWGGLLIVADGMGGLNAGEVASRLAVEGVQDFFINLDKQALPSQQESQHILKQAILHANERIIQHAQHNPETEGMGTTLTLGWIRNNILHVCWSGDSRCYLLPKNGPIRQVSKDHSLVQEMLDKKQITSEEAFYHPKKNIITQSLGDLSSPPKPDYVQTPIATGDRILLCSDGLNTMLTDDQIATLLGQGDVQDCCKKLTEAANDAGGYDNITVVVCEVEHVEGALQPHAIPTNWAGKSTMRFSPAILALLTLIVMLAATIAYLLWPSDPKPGEPATPGPEIEEISTQTGNQERPAQPASTNPNYTYTPPAASEKKDPETAGTNIEKSLPPAATIYEQINKDNQNPKAPAQASDWATDAKKSLENIQDLEFKEKLEKIIDDNRKNECEAYRKLLAVGKTTIELKAVMKLLEKKCAGMEPPAEQKKK